jgi:hypothetical protein
MLSYSRQTLSGRAHEEDVFRYDAELLKLVARKGS